MTDTPTTDTAEWLVEGGLCAELWWSTGGYRAAVVTIERLTSAQVQIAGRPSRFRRSDLQEIGSRGRGSKLCPLSDPVVVACRARAVMESAFGLLDRLERSASRGVEPEDLLAEAQRILSVAEIRMQNARAGMPDAPYESGE